MSDCVTLATKQDLIQFLTNDLLELYYDDKHFTKNIKGHLVRIKMDGRLVYEVHLEKKVLIVVNALYCTFNRDEYWDVAKQAGLEEVIADPDTLIRI